MLAKIPPRREDLKSSFADLIEYITNRDEQGQHLGDEVDQIDLQDRVKQLKILARAREHLRLAANYLRQSPQIDGEFQRRALARRALLGLEKTPIRPAPSQAEAEALADLLSGRLLGQAERLVTPTGVACEHNCLSLSSAAAEMNAVAAQNARVKDAVYHIVLSWPANESPTDAQAFECGAHALSAVGMADHQYVFAVHRDTDNAHLHIAVNRVNPNTFRAVYPDRDYFKLDRAMRELELKYGWQHENGPYAVFERNGQVVIDRTSKSPSTNGKRPTPAADMERHADQESLFSYARGEPRKALLSALKNDQLTWRQLHNLLARYGLELREKGQGFAIYDLNSADTTPIKASDMHEELGRARLIKRLGAFEPSRSTTSAVLTYDKDRPPKRDPKMREERRQERAQARRELRARYGQYKSAFVYRRLDPATVRQRFSDIREAARRKRREIRETVPDAAARNVLYSVVAFETLRERDRLRREIRKERQALYADPTNRRLSYREWVEQQAATGDSAAIGQLRGFVYSEKRRARELGRALANNDADGVIHVDDVDPVARNVTNGLHFHVRRDGAVVYRWGDGRDAFIDLGRRIDVLAKGASDEISIATALRLAAEKYGGAFELTGSEQFKRRAIALMVEHGIDARLRDGEQEALRRAKAAAAVKQTPRRPGKPRKGSASP
ncbi:TraI/MobA(P) family conjugative relaxase [Burkholderia multivorans]|uniref:TraI/MobA(P) family conjugative relaxase n=1 Tax=Burkholderia multivorans TaxID=87883 RepID=UPI0020B206A2|nr:TraI/MobA(P) family conjugative relaxase [Burkholderia multivorans]